jgi:hypothetical protein
MLDVSVSRHLLPDPGPFGRHSTPTPASTSPTLDSLVTHISRIDSTHPVHIQNRVSSSWSYIPIPVSSTPDIKMTLSPACIYLLACLVPVQPGCRPTPGRKLGLTHEYIIRVRTHSSDIKQLHKVKELSMDISTYLR